jgi:hypothetical protein
VRAAGVLGVLLSDATVEVPPGGRATLRAEVTNAGAEPVSARVRVTGRASSWLTPAEGGDVVDVPPAGGRTVTLLARPPRTVGGGLVPFAVHVEADDGGRASATGLVVVVPDKQVEVSIAPASVTARRTAEYTVELRSAGEPGVVAVTPGARATRLRRWLDAPTVAVAPDGTASVGLLVQAARPALLAPVRHDVVVDWELLGDGDAHGTARAVLQQRPLLPLPVTLVVLLVTFLVVVVGARVLLGRDPFPSDLFGSKPAATDTQASGVTVPYVHLGAVPQDPDRDAALESARDRAAALAEKGIAGVRVVPSSELPDAAPGDGLALWVLVLDGFADAAEARTFCDEHERAAPGCTAVG